MAPPTGIPPLAVEIVSPTSQMFNALTNDAGFRIRFTGLFLAMCSQVLGTPVGTGSPIVTAGQQAYARLVIANPFQYATTLILFFVHRPNLANTNIWIDLSTGTTDLYCDVTDAAILSQLANDWALISGA